MSVSVSSIICVGRCAPQPCHPAGADSAASLSTHCDDEVRWSTVRGIVDGSKIVSGDPRTCQGPCTKFGPPKFTLLHCCAAISVAFPTFRALRCATSSILAQAAPRFNANLGEFEGLHTTTRRLFFVRETEGCHGGQTSHFPESLQCPHSKVQSSPPVAASFANHLQP